MYGSVCACARSLLSHASFYYFVDFLYLNSWPAKYIQKRNDDGMNILHLSIVVYIGNGDGSADVATAPLLLLLHTRIHSHIFI